jgi:hypothetical protein
VPVADADLHRLIGLDARALRLEPHAFRGDDQRLAAVGRFAALPYLRFPVSVELSHRVDRIVGKIPGPLTRHLFVNQVVVATKPK